MKILNLKKIGYSLAVLMLFIFIISAIPPVKADAGTATPISFGKIDYDDLTLQVFDNNNSIVYYSTDGNIWTEVEGAYDSLTAAYSMDISWISDADEATLYFKGNSVNTVKSITLPAKNKDFKVLYDKIENEFTFDGIDDIDTIEWRKQTDYNWIKVDLDEDSTSYHNFQNTMEILNSTGAKIIFRTPQIIGTGSNNVGARPSKEISFTLTKRAAAPSVTINPLNMTLNTTTLMEYYDPATKLWIECDRSMPISDLASDALYENGSKAVTVMIRKAATTYASYSKTAYVNISGQLDTPTIGDNSADFTYYYMNSKLVMQFHKVTATSPYEYTVVKPGYSFDETTAGWRLVTNNNLMYISTATASQGCRIYIRKKGNSTTLPSAATFFTVQYPSMQ